MIPSCSAHKITLWDPGPEALGVAQSLGSSKLLASILMMRGVSLDSTSDVSSKWISPDIDFWLDKVDLGKDSKRAAEIWSSLPEDASVVVYGDYDVDGIASTTFMMDLALMRGARARYYIPHRNIQGYGFHPDVVDTIARSGVKCDMLAVVDCGTQNVAAAERASAHGIPTLIFDHHLARDLIASSDALVNPQLDGNELARKLCAAGVVWSWAWKNALAPREWLLQKLDVVALATIADCVSMESPANRAMTRRGIEAIRKSPRDGLTALMRGLDLAAETIDSDSLAMKVIPCLNAAGRLEFADLAMHIFFPPGDVDRHASHLVELNHRRRDLSAKIVEDVETSLREDSKYKHVMFGEDWPPGVLSSVASHICSAKDTPVAFAAPTKPDMIRGTLRVPPGVDAEAILSKMSDDLVSWGGHRMAAGFSVERRMWGTVRDRLEELLSDAKAIDEPEDVLVWDPSSLDISIWRDAERLGPFGVGNPHPRLFCRHKGPIDWDPLGNKGLHIKVKEGGCELLAFGGKHLTTESVRPSGWIYKPRVNHWRNRESLQFVIERSVGPA